MARQTQVIPQIVHKYRATQNVTFVDLNIQLEPGQTIELTAERAAFGLSTGLLVLEPEAAAMSEVKEGE